VGIPAIVEVTRSRATGLASGVGSMITELAGCWNATGFGGSRAPFEASTGALTWLLVSAPSNERTSLAEKLLAAPAKGGASSSSHEGRNVAASRSSSSADSSPRAPRSRALGSEESLG